MATVPNSQAQISNILNFRRTRKVMDAAPLTHKFANRDQVVIQGQECFTKCASPQAIPPVVRKEYYNVMG